jgi:uncharacterized protein YfdQ (DUF2303 family)
MDENNIQSAINAGLTMGGVRLLDNHPYVVVPKDARIECLEGFLESPTRKRGTVTLNDVGSFVAYVNAEKTIETRLYGSYAAPGFTAVFNDHDDGGAGWRDYRANYACPLSIEWKTWKGMDGKQMLQEQFAQFIENNLPDIANPPAADMLEISRSLEAKKKVNFASGIRLSNGQNELTYEEEISGTASKGKLIVPEEFIIGIPVLEGGIKYAVTARLRYRIGDGGKMAMWYELLRPHKIVEDAVFAVWNDIADKTELPVFNGSTD